MEITFQSEYKEILEFLKQKIKTSQIRASLSINHELINLYWSMGHDILEKQRKTKWGSKFLHSLSLDLQKSFPGIKGFSVRNLSL